MLKLTYFCFYGYFFISVFGSLVVIPVSNANSVVGLNICEVTAGIKKHNSRIKKRKEKNMIK